uniref:Coiled-coil domain-containing protein 116-like n=1 Tax=Camelus bactrianus TaxID=9837 RepID=A0A9W3G608_CAMBA
MTWGGTCEGGPMGTTCAQLPTGCSRDVARPPSECPTCRAPWVTWRVLWAGGHPRWQEWHDISPFPSLAAVQSPNYKLTEKKLLPSILSESSGSHLSNPWQEELVSYLRDQAVSLLIYKYKFEKNLTRQLGFISFPVTEALMDLFLGFKKVKGSRIHL